MRDTILITHANPEDNTVARWFASRLNLAGYKVWLDFESLRGGTDFWNEIEHQLRENVARQIVLVSQHVRKQGVLKELALGDMMKKRLEDPDCIIPVRVDDIDFSDFPSEIFRLNARNAYPHWAPALRDVLEDLELARIPRSTTVDESSVRRLIEAQEIGRKEVLCRPETLLTNWFPIVEPRPSIRLYALAGLNDAVRRYARKLAVPHVKLSGRIVTFATKEHFPPTAGTGVKLSLLQTYSFDEMIRGRTQKHFASRTDARRHLADLLRQCWDGQMSELGLKPMSFANGSIGWFFPDGLVDGPIKVVGPTGRNVSRVMSGKFKERRWHFCMEAKPVHWPEPIFRVRANMALSEDGVTALPGDKTQRRRARATKSWFNDKWRDMLLAGMHFAGDGTGIIRLTSTGLSVATIPHVLEFPVSYDAKEQRASEETEGGDIVLDDELDDEDLEDDEDA